jgi:DNA-binding MarR family transcriptional regulator
MPYVSHEKLIEENKPDYYMALRKSQKTFKAKKEDIEKILSQKQIAVWQYLNQVKEATPGDIAEKTGVARPTVNQSLDKLLRLKRIERLGLGRSTRYRKLD